MSLVNEFLTSTSQSTLSDATITKFIAHRIIFDKEADDQGFFDITLPAGNNLKINYPDTIFNKIPEKINTLAFVLYLGFKNDSASKVFLNASLASGNLDGYCIFNQAKSFAQDLTNSLDEAHYDEILRADVRRLEHRASQSPGLINPYLARSGKTFNQMTRLDYLFEIWYQRVSNLQCLGRAIDKFVPVNLENGI